MRQPQQTNGRDDSSPRLTVEQVDRVGRAWKALTHVYGPAFTSAYGDEPNEIWAMTIAGLGEDEIRAGLTKLARAGREFAPNLGQFVAACRPQQAGPRFLGPKVDLNHLKLGPPKAPTTVAEKYLANMRTLFGKAPKLKHERFQSRVCTCRGRGECETCRHFAEVIGEV